jgi:hypothetical protein
MLLFLFPPFPLCTSELALSAAEGSSVVKGFLPIFAHVLTAKD